MSALQVSPRIPKLQKWQEASAPQRVPAERVRKMLREIAFVLHATRVVRQMGGFAAHHLRLAKRPHEAISAAEVV